MKTKQLQIRVSPEEKASLKRKAREAGQDVSTYVLSRVLPGSVRRFEELLGGLGLEADRRFALAAMSDLLTEVGPNEIAELPAPDLTGVPPETRCQLAAMVEQAVVRAGVPPPRWVATIEPLETPRYATRMRGLRLHLLRASPVAFRRRNLFVDSAVGDRV